MIAAELTLVAVGTASVATAPALVLQAQRLKCEAPPGVAPGRAISVEAGELTGKYLVRGQV